MSSNGATSTYFGYDGVDMVGEYNGSGALLRRYVHGPGSDEPLVWYEGSGTSDRRFLIADELGSIATVADASGAALANNTYTEFGAPGGSNTGRFQYTGQTWLPEAGLYNYKARVYSAALGRFLQTDPIGFEGGLNFYAYVGNDPINFVDPSGTRQTCWVIYRKERIEGTTVIAYDRHEECVDIPDVHDAMRYFWYAVEPVLDVYSVIERATQCKVLTFGVDGTAAGVLGAGGGLGAYVDRGSGKIGLYGLGGIAVGSGVTATVGPGIYRSRSALFEGTSVNFSAAAVFGAAAAVNLNPEPLNASQLVNGASAGVAFGAGFGSIIGQTKSLFELDVPGLASRSGCGG